MGVSYTGTIPAPWIAQAVFEFDPQNQKFIAGEVARPINSSEKQGSLPKITRKSTMAQNAGLQRAPGANYQRGDFGTGGTPFECIDHGYEHKIPVETEALYRSIMQAQVVGGRTVKGELFAGREKRIADLLFDIATWTGASLFTDYHAAPWDAAASDVRGQVAAAKEYVRANTGLEANALICSQKQVTNLTMVNTAISGLLTGITVATPDAVLAVLAPILGLKYIFAGKAVYNSGNEADTTATVTDIWDEDLAMVCRVAETDDPSEPCIARIINWDAMGPGTDIDFNLYFEPQTKSTIVQGDLYEDEVVVDKYLGHLMEVDPTS